MKPEKLSLQINRNKKFIFIFILFLIDLSAFSINKVFLTNEIKLPILIDFEFVKSSITQNNEINQRLFMKEISHGSDSNAIFKFGSKPPKIYSNGFFVIFNDTFVVFSFFINNEFESVFIANFDSNGLRRCENVFFWYKSINNHKYVNFSLIDVDLNIFLSSNEYNSDSFSSRIDLIQYDSMSNNFFESTDTLIKWIEINYILENIPERSFTKREVRYANDKYGIPFFLVNPSVFSEVNRKDYLFFIGSNKEGGFFKVKLLKIQEKVKAEIINKRIYY